MSVTIRAAERGTAAERLRLPCGTKIISINGRAVNDMLDYGFFETERLLEIECELPDGTKKTVSVKKGVYEELGFLFDSFLMDDEHSCRNKCLFCFIDQLPEGMRAPLYFKDDDERLSYLFGNYITLTNMSDAEIERIIEMRISPINISVHASEPELRNFIMGNRFAGGKLGYIEKLAKSGIEINCQIVLCRDINDGEHLDKTVEYLAKMYPSVQSVSAVPAGLTAHREGLYELRPYEGQSSKETLERIERLNGLYREKLGVGFIYPADEWYVQCERQLPPLQYYDELLQLENGVGMLSLLREEFEAVLERAKAPVNDVVSDIITGEAAAEFINELAKKARDKFPQVRCRVHAVKNNFFGGNVTVAGLLTGKDITEQVSPDDISGRVLLSETVLRREGDLTLDDFTPDDLERHFKRKIRFVSGGEDLLLALLGE